MFVQNHRSCCLDEILGTLTHRTVSKGQGGQPKCLEKMAVADAVPEAFLKGSICFRHNVRQVPLKPEVDAKADPAMAAVLRESRDGMRNFFPLGMLPEDIGSNRGLLLLLTDLFGVQPKVGHYSFLPLDCNIYLRMLKVDVIDDLSLILMDACWC